MNEINDHTQPQDPAAPQPQHPQPGAQPPQHPDAQPGYAAGPYPQQAGAPQAAYYGHSYASPYMQGQQAYPYAEAPAPPQKKSNAGMIVAIVLCVVVLLIGGVVALVVAGISAALDPGINRSDSVAADTTEHIAVASRHLRDAEKHNAKANDSFKTWSRSGGVAGSNADSQNSTNDNSDERTRLVELEQEMGESVKVAYVEVMKSMTHYLMAIVAWDEIPEAPAIERVYPELWGLIERVQEIQRSLEAMVESQDVPLLVKLSLLDGRVLEVIAEMEEWRDKAEPMLDRSSRRRW